MTHDTTRRTFLQAGLAGAAFPFVRPLRLPPQANSKLQIAGVGVGGKGWSDIASTSKGQTVVALCDIDAHELDRGKKQYPGAALFRDWRRMLDHDGIDAVTVSTPDHMHAAIAMAAMRRNKHVYVQKPLTHSVFEARQLLEMARRSGVVTQMGNQHRSNQHMKGAKHLVQTGAIGAVREAHVWTDRPIWPQGMVRPAGSNPVPGHVAWDLWLGVAPERPFVPDTYHRFKWRGFWDFGTGALGDMGCHLMDPIVFALDLPAPNAISAEGPPPGDDTAPTWCIVRYEFPANGPQPASTLTWYDGGKLPPQHVTRFPKGRKVPTNGAVFVGETGSLFVNHDSGPWLIRDDWFADVTVTEVEANDHYQQWTAACKGDGKTISAFDTAVPLTETVLLGNVAYRIGKRIEWDAKTLTVTNAPDAAPLVRREYRDGWDVDWID